MRRIKNHTGGIGYWAAVDAARKMGVPVVGKKGDVIIVGTMIIGDANDESVAQQASHRGRPIAPKDSAG